MASPFRRRVPAFRQHDVTDCAAACLASIAAHHGLRLSLARIRQFASTDQLGTNVLGLVEAAQRIGFTARGVRANRAALASVPVPAIAHVIRGRLHHYLVLARVTRDHVEVMDPAEGKLLRRSHDEFAQEWSGVLVLLTPGERFRPGRSDPSRLGRFWSLLRPHRSVLAQALVGAVLYTVLGLATAIYVQKLLDHVIPAGNWVLLHVLSLGMLVLVLVQLYLGVVKDLLTLRTGQRIDAALILGYYQHLLRLPQRFFDTMRVGEIIARVNDAVKIRAFLNDLALSLTVNLLVVVFSAAFMFVYNPTLALLLLGVIPCYGFLYYLANRLNRSTQRRAMEEAAELEAQLVESLKAIGTIKRFGLEEFAGTRTEVRFVRVLRAVYRSARNSLGIGHGSNLVSRLSVVMLLWLGTALVLSQRLTPGELMSFYTLLGFLATPVVQLIGTNRAIQDALIAADRLFEILDLEGERRPGLLELKPEMIGDIRFEDVHFRYGSRRPVLQGLTLRLERGRTTAVVGESGSGKSTLLALLQGLYPLDSGRIRIGEMDLAQIDPASLRARIAIVPQTVDLFDGSVLDNIAVGEYEPDVPRAVEVCNRLGMQGLLEELPDGLLTAIGENGVRLSGGQRQRLALARALYRRPEILILDEATSNLDSISERHVQDALAALRAAGGTVILIAHRLSTVMGADRIVVLHRGAVVEEGTHAELLRRKGTYHELWRTQFGAPNTTDEPPLLEAAPGLAS